MNRSFHPFFGKQNALRAQLENLQGRYEAEVQENFVLTEQNITLRKQIRTLEVQMRHVQENLMNCIIFWQEIAQPEMDTLRGKVADRDEEIARLKHKKLPTRKEV